MACDRHFSACLLPTLQHSVIEFLHPGICSHRPDASFDAQEPQDTRPGFTDPSHPPSNALEPLAVTARLNAAPGLTRKRRVKLAHLIKCGVKQTLFFNLTIACSAPLDELLPGVEIYATIDRHGDSPFLHSSLNRRVCLAAQESHLFHHITT